MRSISFPRMFKKNTTLLVTDKDATKQNLSVLLRSEQGELRDDPFYGINLKAYLFDQNSDILKDMLIDDIYTKLVTFMPQLTIERKSINIVQKDSTVQVQFRAQNKADFETNMYNLVLFNTEEVR